MGTDLAVPAPRVDVGMREFRKRLAGGAAPAPAPKTQVEDVTQDPKLTRTRARAKRDERNAPPKRPTAAKTTRKTRATTKMSLAEVKMQLLREQHERVEQRIQTLQREAKPTASAAVAAAPVAAAASSTAGAAPAVATPVTVAAAAFSSPPVVASTVQEPENSAVEPTVAPSPVQQVAANEALSKQPSESSAFPTASVPVSGASALSTEPPSSPAKNEFIADDMEEDLIFAMALEEVEQKLMTPQKLPSSSAPVVAPDANLLTTASPHVPVASPVPAKPASAELQTPVQPTQKPYTSQPPWTETEKEVKQEATLVGITPDVLKEMERLRRENELLRRSNELLQAAVTSPTQAEAPIDERPHLSGKPSDAAENSKHEVELSKEIPSDNPAPTPTARYLDLTRCDSDQDINQTAEENRPKVHTRDEHHTDSRNAQPGLLHNTAQDGVLAGKSEDLERNEDFHALDNENKPGTEDISTEYPAALSSAPASEVHIPNLATPFVEDSHLSRSAIAGVDTKEVGGAHASTERVPATEYSPLKDTTVDTSGHVTTGSDDGNVSDVSMVEEDVDDDGMEVDEEEEESIQEDNGPAPRTSTIDSGNYTQYKVDSVDVDDESEAADLDIKTARSEEDSVPKASAPTNAEREEDATTTALGDAPKPGTPANSDGFERTTAPSNTDDDEEEEDDEVIGAKRVKRREVIVASSESESESESDDDSESYDTPSGNVLEAALKAAGGRQNRLKQLPTGNAAARRQSEASHCFRSVPAASAEVPYLSTPTKPATKKRKNPSLSTTTKKPASVKSSLLWPALDEFYDFLLDLSPRNVRGSEQKRVYLQQYANGKLPAQHSSIEAYCNLQLDAIMEELVASVSNTTDRKGGGGTGPTRHLSLSSVSPCGAQGLSTSSVGLSFGAIFSESGFTGHTSNNNDYILTFDASVVGKKSSSDFMSGDLILVRSPRWKDYEMRVFGVVLCDSVVAVGGKNHSGGKHGKSGSGDSEQICVLIRAQLRDRDNTLENFNVLTELCLSNQRVANWRWTLQHVHNTTTSAREFQAIKAISFFPNDLKQVLLRGQLVPSNKSEQASKKPAASSSILSPRLLKYLQKHYNDSQMQAILGCLGEDSRVIIQGPVRTGKTKTILGLLSALLDGAGLSTLQKAKGTARIRVGASLQSARTSAVSKTVAETSIRVLVAAPSNAAVDELVVRVLSEGLFDGGKGESYRPRIVRVGRPESSQQLSSLAAAREASESKKNRKKMRKYAREVEEVLLESLVTKHRSTFPTVRQARQAIIKNAQIVFCTLSGAGSVAMCEFAQDFDALIIDEAAQAVEASTLIPFKFRPHRVVLVGDHRQLPATVISKKLVTMGYDRSLQQRLVENDSPVLLLTQQYRMHPEIAEFPSTYFYGGRLVQDDNMREWTAQDYHRDRASKPLLFLDVQGAQSQVSGSTSLRNMSEVEAVIQLVRRLLKKFPHIEWRKRIGVIAPYKQQIYEVRGAIGRLESEFDRHLGIEVNTVDGFQGREKEIIIYSCVRTSHGGRRKKKRRSRGNDEEDDVLDAFWADERRMNVAITRAKSSLWIVGNSNLLKQSRAWRALIQHTKDHNRYIGDGAATLFAPSSSTHNTSKASSKSSHRQHTRRGRKPNDPKGFKVKMNGRFQEAAWVMHKSRVVAHREGSEMATETQEQQQRRLERRREIEMEMEARRIVPKRRRVASCEEGEDELLESRDERDAGRSQSDGLMHLPTTGWRCPGIVPDAFYREHMELVHAFAKYYVGSYRVNVVRDLRSDRCVQ
ncbi:unnamed protein product [Phytophthora lilii]|uniref:Unnamed protein product n=1 Tax=Phytophthora lilii TaxID=2077276 RepID=A0A9W6WMT4_9STRA|nr:unnamed protein product [Phytophthora lilii]